MTIQHVRQKDAKGCVIACLSMVSGIPYDEVSAAFIGDRSVEGLSLFRYDVWLNQMGYAVNRLYKHYGPLQADRVVWPIPPFAPVHIVAVNGNGSHAVVMKEDGTVLDPEKDAPCRLSDYADVAQIAGIFKVCDPMPQEKLIGLHWSGGSPDKRCIWCGAPNDSYHYHDECPARSGLTTP